MERRGALNSVMRRFNPCSLSLLESDVMVAYRALNSGEGVQFSPLQPV
jgi:hypothetical protein